MYAYRLGFVRFEILTSFYLSLSFTNCKLTQNSPLGELIKLLYCIVVWATTNHKHADLKMNSAIFAKAADIFRKPVCKKKASAQQPTKNAVGKPKSQSVQYVGSQKPAEDDIDIFQINQVKPEPAIIVPMEMNDTSIPIELDTGAGLSVISEKVWKEHFPDAKINPSPVHLRTYTGEKLNVVGQTQVEVKYEGQNCNLPIQIVQGNVPVDTSGFIPCPVSLSGFIIQ